MDSLDQIELTRLPACQFKTDGPGWVRCALCGRRVPTTQPPERVRAVCSHGQAVPIEIPATTSKSKPCGCGGQRAPTPADLDRQRERIAAGMRRKRKRK